MNGLKIHFWLFRAKINSKGTAPVYLRVTKKKVRFQMSTGVNIQPELWDSKKNRVKGNAELSQAHNSLLT